MLSQATKFRFISTVNFLLYFISICITVRRIGKLWFSHRSGYTFWCLQGTEVFFHIETSAITSAIYPREGRLCPHTFLIVHWCKRSVFAFVFLQQLLILSAEGFNKLLRLTVAAVSILIKLKLPQHKAYCHKSVFKVFRVNHLQHPIIKGLSRQGKSVPLIRALSQE